MWGLGYFPIHPPAPSTTSLERKEFGGWPEQQGSDTILGFYIGLNSSLELTNIYCTCGQRLKRGKELVDAGHVPTDKSITYNRKHTFKVN